MMSVSMLSLMLAPLMLMNLQEDPAEAANVATEFPEKTRDLLRKMEKWEKGLSAPRWYDGSDWQHWQEQQLLNHRMVQ